MEPNHRHEDFQSSASPPPFVNVRFRPWAVINALAKCQNLKFKDYIKEEELKKHEKEFGSPRLCVLVNVGDKPLTYKEQAEWSKKIYGVTTLVAKIIEQNSSSTKTTVAKEEVKQTDDNKDITQQLKDLSELHKSGALTKEEFTKAKKKLLN